MARKTVAQTVGHNQIEVGSFHLIRGKWLTCTWSGYIDGDQDHEGAVEAGYYASYAEPTDEERTSVTYQAAIAAHADEEERKRQEQQRIAARNRQEMEEADAWRREHPEQTAKMEADHRAWVKRTTGKTDDQIVADERRLNSLLDDLLF